MAQIKFAHLNLFSRDIVSIFLFKI